MTPGDHAAPTAPAPDAASSRCRVSYVAGTGRSGSTLVAQYLERRTSAVHVGELRYIWDRGITENHLCECGRAFDKCLFWTQVLKSAFGSDLDDIVRAMGPLSKQVDRIRRIPQLAFRRGGEFDGDARRYGAILDRLYLAVADTAGTNLIIDSSKDPSYLYAISTMREIDIEPIHLVRDPRAVAYSWTRKRRRPEIHWEVRYMRTLPPKRAARNWLQYNALIDAFLARHGSVSRLRYEDFARDPDGVTETLAATTSMPLTATVRSDLQGHSLSGNPMRFDRGPLVVRLDEEWRTAFPAADRRLVTAITWPLLRRYGYAVSSREPQPVLED